MKKFKCQVGAGGLKINTKKREGDKATPIGKWKLKSLYYRSDTMLKPIIRSKIFKINKITINCGWCDDPNNHNYNKFINIKNLSSKNINFEKLWRKDQAYDIVIETSYNTQSVVKGKGRHDPCVVPRAVPIVESMAANVLVDLYLQSKK